MKTADQVKPSYAPLYAAACYPILAKIFVTHGYALAVHGSLGRDLDLIAVPWVDKPSDIPTVIAAVHAECAVRIIGDPEQKPHGRIAYTLSVGFGECAVDLSFIPAPVISQPPLKQLIELLEKRIGTAETGYWGSVQIDEELRNAWEAARA